jgi:hypothetical protein
MEFIRRMMVFLVLFGWVEPTMGAPFVPRLVAGQVLTVDSIRSHTLQLLARGQVSEAIDYWVLATRAEYMSRVGARLTLNQTVVDAITRVP